MTVVTLCRADASTAARHGVRQPFINHVWPLARLLISLTAHIHTYAVIQILLTHICTYVLIEQVHIYVYKHLELKLFATFNSTLRLQK